MEQFTAAGRRDDDMMALFDDSVMMDAFGDMPMSFDSEPGGTMMQQTGSMEGLGNGDSSMANSDVLVDESVTPQNEQMTTTTNVENVPGGGPLPPGAFAQMNLSSGSTLTDFTKRRNWPAKVIEEIKDFLHILDANGRIKYVSNSILGVSGYAPVDVQDVFLRDLIHPDDQGIFVAELNESIASGNPLRMFYRLRVKDGSYSIFETVGHAHIAAASFAPNPNNQSPFCQAVFMMARPYPTKNASLLDSFLEHKMENERLRRRINELRREEEADVEESQKQWAQSQDDRSDMTPSEMTGASSNFFRTNSTASDHADKLHHALTKENLADTVGDRPDSLNDKMARYEGNSHAETIEMLTGLRYMEGERSRGITTGKSSPTLIKGDAGIAIPMDRDSRTGEKKKKLKMAEEYVCTDCGMPPLSMRDGS